ncbi:SPOR domain-containing protein [Algicella marina]|uniref:SPOR domain-containing protein n=1 Tax=Algicella marina TaxID=2683284 RepID=A0A6P1T786_9RHOB|nr:SPOR domain-containing protein [Algicella marina]QHQ37149.1 hypothetical protein GO499_19155 [Algicella marina]
MKTFLENAKAVLTLFTTGALAALILGLVFLPAQTTGFIVNRLKTMDGAGVELTGFLGVSVRSKFDEVASDLEATDERLLDLREKLTCLLDGACSETERAEILTLAGLEMEPPAEAAVEGAPQGGEEDTVSGAVIAPEAETVEKVTYEPWRGSWIVVAGADKTLAQAQYELRRLAKLPFDMKIVEREGFFRLIAEFDTQSEANAALPVVTDATQPGSYIRAYALWCRDLLPARDDGVPVCET